MKVQLYSKVCTTPTVLCITCNKVCLFGICQTKVIMIDIIHYGLFTILIRFRFKKSWCTCMMGFIYCWSHDHWSLGTA